MSLKSLKKTASVLFEPVANYFKHAIAKFTVKHAIFSSFCIYFQFEESTVYFYKTVIFGRFAIYL